MSYTTINLNGKERGLKFNQLAIEIIAQYNDTNTNTGFLYAMIYGGLRGNTYVKREEADYTFEEVCDWIDAMPEKEAVVAKVSAAMTETQIWKDLTKSAGENAPEADEKKKA